MSGAEILDAAGQLDVELLHQLHGANRYCLYPLQGKDVPDQDGDQAELVSTLLQLARFGALVRRVGHIRPHRSVGSVIREIEERLAGAPQPGLKPGRLGED